MLLGLLLLQLQGPWIIFKLQQQAIRSQIKQQLKTGVPAEDLVTLRIARAWEEKGNDRFQRIHAGEFRFDGEMYDIVRTEVRGDTTYYTCIHDVRESGLFARLDEMTAESLQEPAMAGKRNRIIEWLSLEYCASGITVPRAGNGFTVPHPVYAEHYSSVSRDHISPPPEYICFNA